MNQRKQKRNSMNTKMVPAAILVIGVVALGAIVLAQTQKHSKPVPLQLALREKTIQNNTQTDTPASTERKPLSYYTGAVRASLFTSPEAAVESAPPAPLIKHTVKLPSVKIAAPAPLNPFADYVYSGTVSLKGETLALIENSKTHDGQYLKQGDTFMGGKVKEIAERSVTLNAAGKPYTLVKTVDFKLLPLDKSADNAPPAAAAPAAAAPGAAGAEQANQNNNRFQRFQRFRGNRGGGGGFGFGPPGG
jgi:hypothetical protein